MCTTLVWILSTHVNVWMLGEHVGLPVSPFLKRWRWKIHRARWLAALVLSVNSGFSWVSFVYEQGGTWFRRLQVSAPDPLPTPWICTHTKHDWLMHVTTSCHWHWEVVGERAHSWMKMAILLEINHFFLFPAAALNKDVETILWEWGRRQMVDARMQGRVQ